MYAKELIGHRVMRTKSIVRKNGVRDTGFTHLAILIRNATDSMIVYTYPNGMGLDPDKKHIAGIEYCDDNWVDCEPLLSSKEDES